MTYRIVSRSAEFAWQAHKGQVRQFDGSPYYFHPISVGNIVAEAGGSDAQIAAAHLHDVVEDTPVTLAEVAVGFGGEVAAIVDGLTKREGETYREFVLRSALTPGAWLVKRSDVLHNMSSLPPGHPLHERYITALRILGDHVPTEIAWSRG